MLHNTTIILVYDEAMNLITQFIFYTMTQLEFLLIWKEESYLNICSNKSVRHCIMKPITFSDLNTPHYVSFQECNGGKLTDLRFLNPLGQNVFANFVGFVYLLICR